MTADRSGTHEPSRLPGPHGRRLAARGAAWTAREIAQQPAVWLQVAQLVGARTRASSTRFLAPLLANPALRIVLTGAGTSAFVGDCLAPALALQLGRRVDAIATTDSSAGPQRCLQADVPTLLVSFARSGNSPESVAAIELADRLLDRVHHLDHHLQRRRRARRARRTRCATLGVFVPPEATNDRASR